MRAWILSAYLVLTAVVSMVALIQVFPTTSQVAAQITRTDSDAAASIVSPSADADPVALPTDSVIQGQGAEWTVLDELTFGKISILGWEFQPAQNSGQGLLILAVLAGILGSFMHAAQSLTSFVGNQTFRPSWVLWYLLRAPVGAVLGVFLYFVLRAGLISTNTDVVSPYGVVTLAGLGGWFSKQATDKLAEIFDQFFANNSDAKRDDKLAPATPVVTEAAVTKEANGDQKIALTGTGFAEGLVVVMGSEELPAVVQSSKAATLLIPANTFAVGAEPKTLLVKAGDKESDPITVDLA